MNNRVSRTYDFPTDTMEIVMVARGKTYKILPADVIHAFRNQEADRIMNEDQSLTKEQVNERIDKILDDLGVGTSSCVYEKMTPEEKARFEAQYRFGGITRVWK